MKVKYIGNNSSEMGVIKNNIYECIGVECGWYRIIDETQDDYLYPSEDFEVIES